jgi:hypothetical protein
VRADTDLPSALIRELWARTLPGQHFTHHCAPVRNPVAIARYVVKHLKDDSKKELPPRSFRGRLFSYSRGFFTSSVAALWHEQLRVWYPASRPTAVGQKDFGDGGAGGPIREADTPVKDR